MTEISETEIKSMTKEQNYMRGYRDGKSDVLNKIRTEIEQIIGERNLDDYDFCSGLICARKIIDKYRAKGSDKDERRKRKSNQ